jgi:molecular chaperone GrpE
MFRFVSVVKPKSVCKTAIAGRRTMPRLVLVRQFSADNTNADDDQAAAAAAAAPASDAEKIAKLEAELKDMKDHLMRSLAEGENIRRIAHRDVDQARAYANTSFAKAMLDISDDLERALSVVPADYKDRADHTMQTLVEGIEMTEKNLQKVFGKFGVVRYGAVNEKFDPNVHEALFQIPDAANEADTVGQVVKTGYKIKDRVLRPAQVGTRFKP